MNGQVSSTQGSETSKIVAAAVVGAVGGFAGTAIVLGSLAFGIFGAIGGAVVSMIAALSQIEHSDA